MRYLFLSLLLLIISSCTKSKKNDTSKSELYSAKDYEVNEWYHLSATDSTAGVGLEKANTLISDSLEQKEIIVAVIDGIIDVNHVDLKNSIYRNHKEIEGNGIDDDNNGYIDDVYGWNFFGNTDGHYLNYGTFNYIEVLKELKKKYNLKDLDSSAISDAEDRKLFNAVLREKNGGTKYGQTLIDWAINHRDNYYEAHGLFNYLFLAKNYSLEDLDTIQTKDENSEKVLNTLKYFKRYGVSIDRINQMIKDAYARKYIINNEDYEPYKDIDSFPNDLDFRNYGNPFVGVYPIKNGHGTQVAGIIGAERYNGIGIKGVSNKIKIMPLETSPTFSERPKDFYTAIKYAVDNGAKIINYSSSKYQFNDSIAFKKAIKYANDNDVLFVKSAGNNGSNLDLSENRSHPNNLGMDGKEIQNFLVIGASTEYIGDNLRASFSNYGKNSVDIFAPGMDMKTTDVYENQYININGTSLSSALVSGAAALIWSSYPNLSAGQVKEAILSSGTPYDVEVNTRDGKKKFSQLSKTGSIINVYEALLRAKEYSENNN